MLTPWKEAGVGALLILTQAHLGDVDGVGQLVDVLQRTLDPVKNASHDT